MRRAQAQLDVADGAMIVVATIWATNNVLTKAILGDRITALSYVFCRFALVTILLFGWLRLRGIDVRMRREDRRRFLFTGLTGYAAYNVLFVVGLSHTSAFSAAILISLGPVFTLVFAALLRVEGVRPLQWIGIAAAFAGVGVFVGQRLLEETPALGDILNILAAACFAAYGLAARPLIRRYGSQLVTAWSVFLGLVGTLPLTVPAIVREEWGGVGLGGWAALFYAGAFSMLLAYTMWGWAIDRRGVGRTAPFLYLVPIFTGVLSYLFLGERFGAARLVGATMVFLGVGLARKGANVATRAPASEAPGVASRTAPTAGP